MTAQELRINCSAPTHALNAGAFRSRGQGTHPTRIIDSFELILVESGMLSMVEGEDEFVLEEGETLLLSPGIRHGGTTPYPSDLSFYWIHFTVNKQARNKKPETIRVPRSTRLARPERLIELFRRFLDDQERGELLPVQADLLLALMLTETTRAAAPDVDVTGQALAGRAVEYITLHHAEEISTASVAQALRCNPDYLGRVFRTIRRHTVTQEIHATRLREGRRLLLGSELNIDEIARSCGYRDALYFRRMFKRAEGMPPGRYRRLYARMHVNTE